MIFSHDGVTLELKQCRRLTLELWIDSNDEILLVLQPLGKLISVHNPEGDTEDVLGGVIRKDLADRLCAMWKRYANGPEPAEVGGKVIRTFMLDNFEEVNDGAIQDK